MVKVARTYRLDPGLVLRVEEEAERRGQSLTVFVSRALEQALGNARPGSADVARVGSAAPAPVRTSEPVSRLPREVYESPRLDEQLREAPEGSALAKAAEVELKAAQREARATPLRPAPGKRVPTREEWLAQQGDQDG